MAGPGATRVSVSDVRFAGALALYPNPAHDPATVQFRPGTAKTALALLDALGH